MSSEAVQTVSSTKKNFNALTGLRFFAALAVVFYHFAPPLFETGPSFLVNLVGSGFVAVSFFYLLSGFVLSYSYVGRDGSVLGTRRSFWVARLARIYPAYLLAFLLAAPFNILGSLQANSLNTALLKLASGAGAVLTLQQAWTPWTAWYWNYPAWSVSVEVFFYLAFPFVAPQLRRVDLRTALWGILLFWAAALLPPAILVWRYGPVFAPGDHRQMAVEFTPLLRLPEFLIGLLLGRAYVLGFRLRPRVAAILGPTAALAVLAILGGVTAIPRPLLANGLLAPLFAVLIYTLAEGEGHFARLLGSSLFVRLGEASFGIYILQIPCSYLLGIPPPQHSTAVFVLYLMFLIIAALLSWQYIETPWRQKIRTRLAIARPERQSTETILPVPTLTI